MVMVDIYNEIYEEAKEVIQNRKLDYPTLQNFINRAVSELVKKEQRK